MADFTPEQKIFVVRCLAEYLTPTETAQALKEAFELPEAPPTSQIARYDPTNRAGKSLSPDLKDEFEAARSRYQSNLDNIPIASQAFRLWELTDLYRTHKKRRPTVAKAMLEQAAKERGGLYQQRENGARPEEVAAYVAERMEAVLKVIQREVKDPQERRRVLEEIKQKQEEG